MGPKCLKLLRPGYLIKKAAYLKIEHEDLICDETFHINKAYQSDSVQNSEQDRRKLSLEKTFYMSFHQVK